MKFLHATLLASLLHQASGHPGCSANEEPCPFLGTARQDEARARRGLGNEEPTMRALNERTGDGGIPEGGFQAVIDDLAELLTNSQDFWPGDFVAPQGPHYGGLFIRLAWHCAGSYRESDGRGGCDGGRIRYDPELNWPDNANLDKALELLKPIKEKYGKSLSWGDLIILSGNTAIKEMGGSILGFCGGRIDDADGTDSLRLGPSDEQQEIGPCGDAQQGQCLQVNNTALGPTTVGLIYVNPGGPVNDPGNPAASADDIRVAFGRMGFSDIESVSLIGGGHAFGKAHGACETPQCGDGKGLNTFTSGFEGAWTTTPTAWSNQYFSNLFNFNWTIGKGPGGSMQWAPSNSDGSDGPDIMMLTSDIALITDDAYKAIAESYKNDLSALEEDFATSWYRLTTGDMGTPDRCIGDMVPAAQPFQHALPASPVTLPDYVPIRQAIQEVIDADTANADKLINLAFRCAETFRATDYRGGCNGARIRFTPESEWPSNAGISEALALLETVKTDYPSVSYADLIVLGGVTALKSENADLDLPFCGGYVDAVDGTGSESLAPRIYATPLITITDDAQVKGLSFEEYAALACRENVGSQYYQNLKNDNGDFTVYEKALLEGSFGPIVDMFAADEEKLLETFEMAWTKMMTADRFKNNREKACTASTAGTAESSAMSLSAFVAFGAAGLALLL